MKPSYKQTEVGVIPEDWGVVSLGEIGRVVRGGSPRPAGDSRFFNGSFIPWLTVGCLTNIPPEQIVVLETPTKLTEEGSRRSRRMMAGTIVIVNSGARTLGVTKILGVYCCANDGIAAIIEQSRGDKAFIVLFLNSQIGHLRAVVASGNDQLNLNTSRISQLKIPFPPEPEQRAISGALEDVDAAVVEMERLIAKKRDLRQAAMQQLLTGQTRLPGFMDTWEVERLGDTVDVKKGQLITAKLLVPGAIPVIAGGRKPAYFHNEYNCEGPVITISASGASAGYVAFHEGSIFASDCSTISEGCSYDIRFLFYSLVMKQEEIYRSQSGGAQPHVHPKDLAPLSLHVPNSVAEQAAIATVLTDMDAELSALQAQLDKTRLIKQAMMQELLTGRTRLPFQ
ncbi:restriction endonuclease subunit S [Mesorhizobium sp. KR1-2]|uniref:restriction endonuclease subunit S n=1 Tax=Mesorhizobium sp. KR1-2 TaxID=3156609 RepID=UPI0032B4C48E